MNTHDKIELPEHDCLYESTNEQGYIDLEPAYRKSTVLRLLEADRQRRGEPVAWRYLTPTGWHATTDAAQALRIAEHHTVEPLCAAPQPAEPVVNQSLTTAASDVLADTQRAIIEAAERRGYERAMAECAQDLEDAERYRWLRPFGVAGLSDAQSFLQCQMVDGNTDHGRMMDAAIDAARAAKGAE